MKSYPDLNAPPPPSPPHPLSLAVTDHQGGEVGVLGGPAEPLRRVTLSGND